MISPTPEFLGAIAAIASSIAAVAAVIVTWRAPISAAKYAEELRSKNEAATEIKRQKLAIFAELMKARGITITRDAVAAFNLIDVVFKDSPHVKDAWAELISLYGKFDITPKAMIEEKLLILLKEIAKDLSLSAELRSADFERYYYPTAIAEEDQAKALQYKRTLEELQAAQSNRGGSNSNSTLFPPTPE